MSSKALAKKMATTARLLRDMIREAGREREQGFRQGLVQDFEHRFGQAGMDGLHELDGEAIADLWVQVVCYEVFLECLQHGNQEVAVARQKVEGWPGMEGKGRMVEAVESLRRELSEGELAQVVQGFGQRGAFANRAVHVYELFLEEYDAAIRERRGVYFTPAPVVAYIVKSVDDVLVSRFGLQDGLADRRQVQVIDPAVGTGAFLQGVIEWVERRVRASDLRWEAFVREHLLSRLHGVEVMAAPHVIAHLTLQARLAESGVRLGRSDRFDVRLGNSLDAHLQKELLAAAGLSHFDETVLVVLGNPPYANFGQMNSNLWIDSLLQTYKVGLNERKTNLHDDYIKFIRLAEWQVEQVGQGIVALVTNHSFLGGLAHRRMRESLLQSFDDIFVLNLHGDFSERHAYPGDENVFEITRGVAITVMVRTKQEQKREPHARVYYRDLVGGREEKYAFLQTNSLVTTEWEAVAPTEGSFSFLPQAGLHAKEYAGYWSLADIFNVCHSGIQTKRDKLAIHFEEQSLADVVEQMRRLESENELETWREERQIGADSSGWRLQAAVEDVRQGDGVVIDVQYRPFDLRKTYFSGRSNGFLGRPRTEVTRQFLQPNLALASMRQLAGVPDRCAVLATREMLTDRAMYSRNGTPYVFPLYSYGAGQKRVHHLNREFVAELEVSTGMRFDSEASDLPDSFSPEDVFAYLYALLHAEAYRERYAEFLKRDFPRVPAHIGREPFLQLVRLGKRLVALHTLDAFEEADSAKAEPLVHFHAAGDDLVRKARYEAETGRLYINHSHYFAPVTPEMWQYRAGGYQVAAQWLKERRGRRLTAAEGQEFCRLLSMFAKASGVIRRITFSFK